jgi:hypothetical protein
LEKIRKNNALRAFNDPQKLAVYIGLPRGTSGGFHEKNSQAFNLFFF